jgi:hypothetical protein
MVDTNYKLILEMEKAEHALTIHTDSFITKEILNSCINLVEKGIAIELFLDSENQLYLEENNFLFNKCSQFVNKGGSIFMTPNPAELRFWQCIVDFKEYSYYSLEEEKVIYKYEKDLPFFQNAFIDFETKKQAGKPYLVEKGDIEIRVTLSDALIMLGDPIELSWEVDGADKVIVQGVGRVEAYGRKKIRLEKNTILKIGASNERQSKIKAILVKVSDDLKISYDIGFIGVGTKEYCSLVNSDIYPHVYGISTGNQLKLKWDVPLAKDVKIMPFGIMKSKGEYTFTPSSSFNIEIYGTVKEKIYIRKIQILLFPIPIFKEKLISTFPFINKKYNISIPRLQKEKIEQMRIVEKQRYLDLNKKIIDINFALRSDKINFNYFKTFFFTVLKGKYFERKEILKEINSIQSYYEPSKSGAGSDERSL